MQFNITFKTIFEYVLKKLVLCIQIRFVSTEKTTRIASRASCYVSFSIGRIFITWKNLQKYTKEKERKQIKRNIFNYVQHKTYKLSSYTTNYLQECMKKYF